MIVYDQSAPYDGPFPYEDPLNAIVLLQAIATETLRAKVTHDATVDI